MLILAKLLKALNSEAGPWQLAFGVMLGSIVGLTPTLRLHNIVILFLVLFFRINLATFLIAFGLFSILSIGFAPAMASIGESMLTASGLNGLWTSLYNTSFGQLSQFHHTLTFGSLVVALCLAPVVLFVSKFLIVQYREKVMAWVEKLWLVQALKSSRFYQIYTSVKG